MVLVLLLKDVIGLLVALQRFPVLVTVVVVRVSVVLILVTHADNLSTDVSTNLEM